jgi:hypothetical protein
VVRLQDAHAWVEIKFRRYGWVPFDPTPRPDPPWALDAGFVQTTRGLQQVLRGGLQDMFGDGASLASGAMTSAFGGGRQAAVYGLPLAIVVAALVAGLTALFKRRRRVRRSAPGYTAIQGAGRDDVREAYRKALAALERKGYPDHGPTEYVDMLDGMGHEVPDAFRRISLDASRAFYDPAPLDVSVAERVKAGLRALRSIPRLALMPDSADTR